MSVTTVGLYRLRWQGKYLSEQVENVSYWLNTTPSDEKAQELADGFDTELSILYANACNSGYEFDNIKATPLFGLGVDVDITPSQESGDLIGSGLAPFSACHIRLNRADRTTSNGFKRIAGLDENVVTNGVIDLLEITLFQAIANAYASSITESGETFLPVIVRSADLVPSPVSINYTGIISGVARRSLTTQNSRKFGVGA